MTKCSQSPWLCPALDRDAFSLSRLRHALRQWQKCDVWWIDYTLRLNIGDAVVGCRDPEDTAHWIEIITGKLFERDVHDGQDQTLRPSLRDVAIAVRGLFRDACPLRFACCGLGPKLISVTA
jgi:hypothetical protein